MVGKRIRPMRVPSRHVDPYMVVGKRLTPMIMDQARTTQRTATRFPAGSRDGTAGGGPSPLGADSALLREAFGFRANPREGGNGRRKRVVRRRLPQAALRRPDEQLSAEGRGRQIASHGGTRPPCRGRSALPVRLAIRCCDSNHSREQQTTGRAIRISRPSSGR
jgi:hypothetical protein